MPDSNSISAVLFDMDGTIFGTEEIWFESEKKLMVRFGADWTRADHAICVGGPMSRVTEYMLDRLNNVITAQELFHLEMEYIEREFAQNSIPWMPGAEDLVLKVKEAGVPIALVTASSQHLVNLVNAQIDLSIFDTIVTGDDVKSPKPDPEPYLHALDKLGITSANSFAIEDSNSGVRSALAADLHVICPPSHTITIDHPKLKIVKSLEGLTLNDLDYKNWML